MNQSKGTIYFRDNAWYKMENVIKMGVSSVVKNRSNGYITGEVERGEYICIIEIPLEKMKILDKCLKMYFKSYHIYKGGGTEFYNRCIMDLIEPYLQILNMEYRIFSKEEIYLINRCERVINIPNVNKVKQIFNQLNVNNIIQKYKNKKISSNPSFYCKDCHTSFQRKFNYETHLTSTKHKIRVSNKNKELVKCSFCNKSFSHESSLSRHRSKCKVEDVPKLDLETEIIHLHKRVEDLDKKNTTTNQTQNIHCFGNENMNYITDKVIIQCFCNIQNYIPMIIERIHFDPEHPENHNIKIPNKKLPHASVMKDSWELIKLDDAIVSMVYTGYNLLDKTFQEKKHLLSNIQQKYFKNFQSKYENGDKKTIKDTKEAVKLLVINKTR